MPRNNFSENASATGAFSFVRQIGCKIELVGFIRADVAMKILIVLFGISLFFKGLQSIVYRRFTTYAGIAETRTVFTNIAAIFWGVSLIIFGCGALLWAIVPEYFQPPIFTFVNVMLAYAVIFILSGVIQLLQSNASR